MIRTMWRELWLTAGLRDARERFLVAGTLALVVVWLYGGSAAAFVRIAGDGPSEWWRWVYYHGCAFGLLAVVPLVVMQRLGTPPSALGIALGDWRFGLRFVVAGIAVLTPVVYVSSFDPAFQAEYPVNTLAAQRWQTWALWELLYGVYYVAWEVYFRGVLLFGLRGRFGVAGALAFQTSVSTLVHIGKPFGEILGAIPGGLLFGAAALRGGSVLWPLIVHWYMGALMDVCARP